MKEKKSELKNQNEKNFKDNPLHISNIISEFKNKIFTNEKLLNSYIICCVFKIIEAKYPGFISEIYKKDKKIYVKLKSDIVRNELTIIEKQLRDELNKKIENETIEKIIFV